MSETTNISKIAEQVSRDLFEVFNWNRVKIANCNWKCAYPDKHSTCSGTHPTDAVWYYDEPYENVRTFIQTDLKSYATKSISRTAIRTSLSNLIMAVECAPDSDEWRRKFCFDMGIPFRVVGLLFIYNHDGNFDTSFRTILQDSGSKVTSGMKPKTRVMVLGPKQIWELYSIAANIKQLHYTQGKFLQIMPFYPEGKLRQFRDLSTRQSVASTIESLFADVLSFKVKPVDYNGDCQHLHVYYRGRGENKEEFLHLIDSFFRYQMIESAEKIFVHHVSLDGPSSKSAECFELARNEIAVTYDVGLGKLNKLEFETLPSTKPAFSSIEIGMRS